jgi:hypothetical protein
MNSAAIRLPPSADPYLVQMARVINAELLQREVLWLGILHDGLDLRVRFRAPLTVPSVRVHVQTDQPGEGGSAYDPANYLSSVVVDCREDRMQEVAVPLTAAVVYFIYLVPVQTDGLGATVLFDGEGGRPDRMSFWSVGPFASVPTTTTTTAAPTTTTTAGPTTTTTAAPTTTTTTGA